MGQLLTINDIKKLYPDEWVLVGNPIMDESKIDVLEGIPLFHSKDKKEVCYIGRDKTSNFDNNFFLISVQLSHVLAIKIFL